MFRVRAGSALFLRRLDRRSVFAGRFMASLGSRRVGLCRRVAEALYRILNVGVRGSAPFAYQIIIQMELPCKHAVLVGLSCATLSSVFVAWQTGWKCPQTSVVMETSTLPTQAVENRTRTRHGKGKGHKNKHSQDYFEHDAHDGVDHEQLSAWMEVPHKTVPATAPLEATLEASPQLPTTGPALPAQPLAFNAARSAQPGPSSAQLSAPKEFATRPEECPMRQRAKQQMHFDMVHKTNSWGSDARITTSGTGSDQKGAYDWVYHINLFILHP